jgi:hypothetical protein
MFLAGVCLAAEEKKAEKGDKPTKQIATVVKTDLTKHTILVKVKGKEGKEQERTIALKEDVKLIGEDGKEDKEAEFFKDLKPGEEIGIVLRGEKVVQVRDLPERAAKPGAEKPHRDYATVVKVLPDRHAITVRMKDKDGKEHEKTIQVKEGVKLFGEDGKEDKEAEFLKELEAGEQILIVEKEGKLAELRDLPAKKKK